MQAMIMAILIITFVLAGESQTDKIEGLKLSIGETFEAAELSAIEEQMKGLEEGDMKEFKIVTDDDISKVEVGDIYKSNDTFFKISNILKKSQKGGVFYIQRYRGNMDPGFRLTRISGSGAYVIATRQTLIDRFFAGGFLMYPIAFLLLVMIIVTISCIFYLRLNVHVPFDFADQCRDAIRKGDIERFEELVMKRKGLLAHICRVIAANIKRRTAEEIKSRIEADVFHQIGRMNFPLRVLNFAAVASPLLGLLGTVTGMIRCFESLAGETATQSKAMAMAAGIKEALLTTAFGLIVALPSLTAYFVFNYRLRQIANIAAITADDIVHEVALLQRRILLEKGKEKSE